MLSGDAGTRNYIIYSIIPPPPQIYLFITNRFQAQQILFQAPLLQQGG